MNEENRKSGNGPEKSDSFFPAFLIQESFVFRRAVEFGLSGESERTSGFEPRTGWWAGFPTRFLSVVRFENNEERRKSGRELRPDGIRALFRSESTTGN